MLTHVDKNGQANMVDVSAKDITVREARAQAVITLSSSAFSELVANENAKGDVLAVARVAGIQAAKKCADLIPLCHPLALTKVAVEFELDTEKSVVVVLTSCKLAGKTGVEMEALTAASVAALTVFDMCKAADPTMRIDHICVLEKQGGKTGHWQRGNYD